MRLLLLVDQPGGEPARGRAFAALVGCEPARGLTPTEGSVLEEGGVVLLVRGEQRDERARDRSAPLAAPAMKARAGKAGAKQRCTT